MNKRTKVDLQDSFVAQVESCDEMDAFHGRKRLQKEELKERFDKHKSNVGRDGKKNRCYDRKGLAVITKQYNKRANFGTALGWSPELRRGNGWSREKVLHRR